MTTNLQKRLVLQQITDCSRVAIKNLDELTHFENLLLAGGTENREYCEARREKALKGYLEAVEKIKELNETLL